MKLKNLIVCLALLLLSLFSLRAGTADSNVVQTTFGLTFDIFPTNTPLITITNTLPAGMPPGNAISFTNGAFRGYLDVGILFTNSSSGYITNWTTHAAFPFGSVLSFGTNYETVFMRLGPNEVFGMLTNNGTGAGITYSETRN